MVKTKSKTKTRKREAFWAERAGTTQLVLKGDDRFGIAQLKLIEGGGRQEVGKTWPQKALLVHE